MISATKSSPNAISFNFPAISASAACVAFLGSLMKLINIIQTRIRQMIKHVLSTFSKSDRIVGEGGFTEFDTFQLCPPEHSLHSNKDSLLFSQSRKADETKELGPMLSSISKQDWRECQNQRGSSIKRNRNETIREQSQGEDALAQYMVSSFEPRHPAPAQQPKRDLPSLPCPRCRTLQEEHRRELSFLTKNNQELYQLNKTLSQQLSQFVQDYESLQQELQQQHREKTQLQREIAQFGREKGQLEREMAFERQKHSERQQKFLRQREANLKTHTEELKIVEQINQCLQQKDARSRDKSHTQNNTAKPERETFQRAKTEYDCDKSNNKQISTMATWEESGLKYTPRKNREMFSDQKIKKEIDCKVSKLSQQKKKIIAKVIKQSLTIEDLQTEIPQTALNKIGKGNVGKLTLAKGNLGRSSTFYGGSISSVQTQKKCR